MNNFINRLYEGIVYSNKLEYIEAEISKLNYNDISLNLISDIVSKYYDSIKFEAMTGKNVGQTEQYKEGIVVRLNLEEIRNTSENPINDLIQVLKHELIHVDENRRDKRSFPEKQKSVKGNKLTSLEKSYKKAILDAGYGEERFKQYNDLLRYLGSPKELKAFAYTLVSRLKTDGFSKKEALNYIGDITNDGGSKYNELNKYRNLNNKSLNKKFYKFAYQYADRIYQAY